MTGPMTVPTAPDAPRRPWLPAWFWYLVALAAALLAVLVAGLLAVVTLGGDTLGSRPVLVEPGGRVDLPARNYLADRVGLYGVLPAGREPASLDLGCDLSDIEGAAGAQLAPTDRRMRPLRVDGRLLQPLARITEPGLFDILSCDGPDLPAASPVYAVGTWDLLVRGGAVLRSLLGAGLVLVGAVAVLAALRGRRAARLRRAAGTVGPVP